MGKGKCILFNGGSSHYCTHKQFFFFKGPVTFSLGISGFLAEQVNGSIQKTLDKSIFFFLLTNENIGSVSDGLTNIQKESHKIFSWAQVKDLWSLNHKGSVYLSTSFLEFCKVVTVNL